jgi:hypothetical protein
MMAKIRAQYDQYSGQIMFDNDLNLFDRDPQSLIDSLSRDDDSFYLMSCEDELE